MDALEYYGSPRVPPRDYWAWWHEQGTVWPCYDIINMVAKIPSAKKFLEQSSLTDLGSGPGPAIPVLNAAFAFSSRIAIDGAQSMLDDIKQNHPLRELIETHCVDLEHETVPVADNSQGLVIACCSIGYIHNIAHVLEESARITRSGGFVAFDTWIHWEPTLLSVVRDSGVATGYAHALTNIDTVTQENNLVLIETLQGGESDISYEDYPLERYTFLYQKK